ncbi:MAG: outer membrane protein assembly factor BamD [Sulfurospirillum sp.]|nr:MAG: outer membrane protein assembly factor BamD [Sulfurospirillum sp.]
MKSLLLSVTLLILLANCSGKNAKKDELFNKSDIFWYQKIIKDVKLDSLDKADEDYTSLASEHVASPLLKEALMILAKAHMKNEEYLMANYYIDEYIKRYATKSNISYLEFLKIKSNFQSFKRLNRDQKLLLDTINSSNQFLKRYQNSPYTPEVQTILTRLYLANRVLNENIVKLYKKTGKLKSAKIYEQKIKNSWLNNIKIKE